MYILHPQWLAKHGIIEAGTEVGIETNLTQPGFRFRFPDRKATWNVTPNRLVIESWDPGFDCGELVARILNILPETPMFALGNNVHYDADLSEWEHLAGAVRDFPLALPPASGQTVAQRSFHVAITRAEHETVNIQVSLKEKEVELACNVHNAVGKQGNEGNEAAIAAAQSFFDHRAECNTLAQHFFGTLIDHGSTDS